MPLADPLAEIHEVLADVAPGSIPGLVAITPRLREAFHADRALSYRVHRGASGWNLDFAYTAGLGPSRTVQSAFESFLTRSPANFASYLPERPASDHRNVGQAQDPDELSGFPIHRDLFPALGLRGLHRMRVLVCDGEELLAWVGVFRSEPFTAAETEALTRTALPIRERLMLERSLGLASLHSAATRASLEAMPTPSFVVAANGNVLQANALGHGFMRGEGAAAALRTGLDGGAGWIRTEIAAPGLPSYHLLVRRDADASARKVRSAAQRLECTDREAEVLVHLVRGSSNREIADTLEISAKTVESHVTHLLAKAGVVSRAALVSLVLSEA